MDQTMTEHFSVDRFNVMADSILHKRDLSTVRQAVIELIDLVDKHDIMLSKIFRHPLGFLDFPISMILNTKYKMRLHFWEAHDKADIQSNIHFHTADILSFVLAGLIQDEQFYITDEGAASTHDILRVEYYDGGSRRVPTGRSGCPVVDRLQQTTDGGVYFVPRSVFHRSTVSGSKPTVTLMVSFNEDSGMSHHALIEKSAVERLDFKHVQDLGPSDTRDVLRRAKHEIIGER